MTRFNNDYCHGAHPAVLQALLRTNGESFPGYGLDEWCRRAEEAIGAHLGEPAAQVHFLLGGTQANYTLISHALRPWESAISADTAHINDHETGAVERTGHKIETAANVEGKLRAADVARIARDYRESPVKEHVTKPRLVFLSSPSESGTVYSLAELEDMRSVCDEYGLYLYVDGARMAYGLGSPESDVSLADFARLADAFTIGGTKCGALFGEALVLANPELQGCFRASMKQGGGMLAKGWLLGLQFATLFEDGLYFEIGRTADGYALQVRRALEDAGIPLYVKSPTNQQFAVLDARQEAQLARHHVFEFEKRLDDGRHVVRFCTSWSTTQGEVNELVADIAQLADAAQ